MATAVRTDERPSRGRMVAGALLFVLGFTLVFVTISTAVGGLGRLLLQHNDADHPGARRGHDRRRAGLPGLAAAAAAHRAAPRPPRGRLAGAPLLGIVFGLGWTPCLGPTLSAVYSLAFTEANPGRGAFLGVAYCLGLGVPFVLVALGARWAVGATSFLRRHARTVTRVGGVVLVGVGLMLVTGAWTELMQWLRGWLAATGLGEGAPL